MSGEGLLPGKKGGTAALQEVLNSNDRHWLGATADFTLPS